MLYWTGSGSDPLVETDLAGNVVSTYIFFGGRRVARRDVSGTSFNVYYYFSDHLGTHSLITDANGTMPPKVESDYYPYGGEIQVFGSDTNHYKFTGKERDSESGLDNFGARFDTSSLGRFMSPDPKMVSGLRLVDPQQWNGYAYARNSTTVFVDPDGRELKLAIYYQGISESVAARVGRLASDKFSKAGVKNVSYELHAGHPSSLTILSYGVPGAIGFSNSSVLELRQGPDATGNLLGSSIPPLNAGQNWHGYSAVDVNWVSSKTSNDAQLAQGLANEGAHEVAHDEITGHPDKPNSDELMNSEGASDSNWLTNPNLSFSPSESELLRNRYNGKDEVDTTPPNPALPPPPPPFVCSESAQTSPP